MTKQIPWPTEHSGSLGKRIESLRIGKYRGLEDVQFDDFRRINLIRGSNKTSLLEAIHLLAHRSDPSGLLHALSMRMHADMECAPHQLLRLLASLQVDLEAQDSQYAKMGLNLSLVAPLKDPSVDLAVQLPTQIRLESTYRDTRQVSITDLFTNRPRRTRVVEGEAQWHVPSVLFPSHAGPDADVLVSWYTKASDTLGVMNKLCNMLAEALRLPIERIELREGCGRFVVIRSDGGPELDLECYGNGLRRMFAIGLLFASYSNGFVLIDEIENSIPSSAMDVFARYIQGAALVFDVQVFATTNTQRFMDVFAFCGMDADEVVAYRLERSNSGVKVDRYSGHRLVTRHRHSLLNSIRLPSIGESFDTTFARFTAAAAAPCGAYATRNSHAAGSGENDPVFTAAEAAVGARGYR